MSSKYPVLDIVINGLWEFKEGYMRYECREIYEQKWENNKSIFKIVKYNSYKSPKL